MGRAGGRCRRMGKQRIFLLAAVMFMSGCSKPPSVRPNLPEIEVQCLSEADEESKRRIEAAVSEITKEYGFTVKFDTLSLEHLPQEVSQRVLDDNLPDVMLLYGNALFVKLISNQVLAPVDQLSAPYPELQNYMKGIRLEGMPEEVYYSFDGNNESVFRMGFAMRQDICRELGIKAEEVNSLDELHQALLKVKKAYPDMILVASHDGKLHTTLGQEALGDNLGVLLPGQTDARVTDFFSSGYFYDICSQMHQWYGEGLILQNAVYSHIKRTEFVSSGNAFGYFLQVNSMTPVDANMNCGREMELAVFSKASLNNVNSQLNWCISATSLHKKEAVKFLQLLFTDPEIGGLCQFGQEGIDYIRLDGGRIMNITQDKSKRWFTAGWGWPNRKSLPVLVHSKNSSAAYGETENEDVMVSPAYGFYFDPEKVQVQEDLCTAVYDKYYWLLVSGMLDPDVGIPLFLEELNANGYQDILKEKQRQLDIWLETGRKE
ncbi:extracellular solute-binding protein [Clostridium sp. MCC353]|uniref:ABC transporter substrate-binding protein n=1 Tax=Clostridium sp. MCC353 TaxID=2592646 RepID=UPI001C018183|nr:ABC transporter substrate-binding protein [Clostridium sp. MCC353]MBT9778732.1 extracellular solute-binding protein [Clostridium sp. MCC353]